MREDCSGRRYRSGRPWGRLTLHGFFQYGAQTEKLQQQLASEKGVHPEVRFHGSQIWKAGPWGLIGSPEKTSNFQAELFCLPPSLAYGPADICLFEA